MIRYLVILVVTATLAAGQRHAGLKVPPIPASLGLEELPTFYLWRFSEDEGDVDFNLPPPRIVLSPNYGLVSNFVPQDSVHPLYTSSGPNADLRNRMLRDFILSPEGIDSQGKATTLEGKSVTFAPCSDGADCVNGIPVQSKNTFPDGTTLYVLNGVPFGYSGRIHAAWEVAVRNSPPKTDFLG